MSCFGIAAYVLSVLILFSGGRAGCVPTEECMIRYGGDGISTADRRSAYYYCNATDSKNYREFVGDDCTGTIIHDEIVTWDPSDVIDCSGTCDAYIKWQHSVTSTGHDDPPSYIIEDSVENCELAMNGSAIWQTLDPIGECWGEDNQIMVCTDSKITINNHNETNSCDTPWVITPCGSLTFGGICTELYIEEKYPDCVVGGVEELYSSAAILHCGESNNLSTVIPVDSSSDSTDSSSSDSSSDSTDQAANNEEQQQQQSYDHTNDINISSKITWIVLVCILGLLILAGLIMGVWCFHNKTNRKHKKTIISVNDDGQNENDESEDGELKQLQTKMVLLDANE